VKQTLYGLLAANANASFRAASSAEMARTLNGTIALDLQKGKLAHVDLLNELANVGKFVGAGFKSPSSSGGQPFTDIVQLTGNFNVVNGLAQTNNLKALIPGGTMAAEGAVNLATEELNMHVTAVLDKAMSQQVGGTQIGGFMQTALANQQGELVIPILLTGTFNSPRVAPDLQKIAQMRLQNLLPTANNPGGLVSGNTGPATARHRRHPWRHHRPATTAAAAKSAATETTRRAAAAATTSAAAEPVRRRPEPGSRRPKTKTAAATTAAAAETVDAELQ
jgi:uncharacterized protein involved in outer membrane biogenesis